MFEYFHILLYHEIKNKLGEKMNAVLIVKLQQILSNEPKTIHEMSDILNECGISTIPLSLENKENEINRIYRHRQKEVDSINKTRSSYFEDSIEWDFDFEYAHQEPREYSIKDVFLVRATDLFSINNLFTVPKDGQVTSHRQPGRDDFIDRILLEKMGINPKDATLEQRREAIKESKKYFPIIRQYRSSKHFTLNTLVSANSGGDWSNMPYIYIESMAHHINDDNLKNVAPHDTFFRGDVQLIEPTLVISKQNLLNLLQTNNPEIIDTLTHTKLILLEDNYREIASPAEYVMYILEKIMNVPYYFCHDHGVSIPSHEGVYKTLEEPLRQRNMKFGSDHFYSEEKKQDSLHFERNIAEDTYQYLIFVRNNPKFNLTEEQKQIFDKAIKEFHELCVKAGNLGFNIDFTEAATPRYIYGEDNKEYRRSSRLFNDLIDIADQAFIDSKFYQTVDLTILQEETSKHNESYKQTLVSSAEANRGKVYKEEVTHDINN